MTVEAPYSEYQSEIGTTAAGQAGNSTTGQEFPDRRRDNPLGNYASSTYQVSLYMITPDSYDDFVGRGRRNIQIASPVTNGKGAYLIAQSGGINNEVSTRGPGFGLDFYIDDLKIKQSIDPKATGTSSATMEMSFSIIEPYGVSFVSRLKKTSETVRQYSSTLGIDQQTNPIKQFFVLGVNFLGYNPDGSIAKETEGMYDKYWDIFITSVKFKIDGKVTTYYIKAAPLPLQVGMGLKKGMLDVGASAKGITVEDMLIGDNQPGGKFGILTKLNYDQNTTKGIERPSKYSVEFIGPYASEIKNATVKSKADTSKATVPMGTASNTNTVNAKTEYNSPPNINASQVTFTVSTPVLQAIQQIISQSSYIEDALKVVSTSDLQPNPNTGTPNVVKPKSNKKLKWFNVSFNLSNPRYDGELKDYAFDITYVIQSYEVPVILIPNANGTTPYYGPIKRYKYWYTGKNSEILKYEQTLDNTYYMVVLNPTNNSDTRDNEASISEKRNQRAGVQVQGKTGVGTESYNEVLTQLISPGDFARAKIEILGDPDWLMDPAISSITSYDQFYGADGFTVNPNTGQVFIEIDFKEAVDYNTTTGTLDINENILFWDYPPEIKDQIEGISYRVIIVTHSFKGGKFTQELDCILNIFGNKTGAFPSRTDQRADENISSTTTSSGTTTESTGMMPVPTVNTATIMETDINTAPNNTSVTTEYDT